MKKFALASAVDAAYWFLQYAENNHLHLEDEKLHHLLFLAQMSYLKLHPDEVLFPAMFLVSEKGFFEPNLLKIFANGHPFMPPVKLADKLHPFMQNTAQQFAQKPLLDLRDEVLQTEAFKNCFKNKEIAAVDISQLEKFAQDEPAPFKNNSRIRLSQRGPVFVSPWKPKKINAKD